jgi:gas vesicle protein
VVEGKSFEEEREWRGAGALGLGIIAGALVGAGVALLLAPQSGAETREQIADRARRFRTRADEGWDDLRDELRRLRRRSRRAATRGRWKVEDLLS